MSKLEEIVAALSPEKCIGNIDALMSTLDEICIYGAGGNGQKALRYFADHGKRVVAFGDSDPQKTGTSIQGIPVVSSDDLTAFGLPIAIASGWAKDIARTLHDKQVARFYDFTNITYLYAKNCLSHVVWEECFDSALLFRDAKKIDSIFARTRDTNSIKILEGILRYRLTMNSLHLEISPYEQYFSPDVPPRKGMVIADCGAWEGDSTLRYAEFLDFCCTIYAFEPMSESFKKLYSLSTDEKTKRSIYAYNTAIGDKIGKVNFKTFPQNSMACSVEEILYPSDRIGDRTIDFPKKGNTTIECITIDSFFRNRQLDLLKMDIEGYELNGLYGACGIIKKHKPDMHICVYHNYFDFYEIPLFIDSIQPGYKFFFGHHNQHLHETVLYAHFAQI
jgi:FkbM family methyltransferase